MAFSNYSNLFKCGLLSEGTSPYGTSPWSAEYHGPRRESLPSIDALSEISDFSTLPLPPLPSSSGCTAVESAAPSEESFYFTFKKKRNPAEHRSFLSLDLAESQSLRSLSLKGKNRETVLGNRKQLVESSFFSPTFFSPTSTVNESYLMPIFSPTALISHPGTPISAHSVPDPSHPIGPKQSTSSPQRSPTIIHAPSPRHGSYLFPTSPTLSAHTQIQRELSPMRFADPSPPPLDAAGISEIDVMSERSLMSAEVLSRSSTVSSGYRKAQRWDALNRLEGRGADGAVGRLLKPRLSQNFMHLSDDEDEEEQAGPSPPPGKSMNVIVEDYAGEQGNRLRQSGKSQLSKGRGGLSISINGPPWYNLTPRQSAWGVLFGGEIDGDIDVDVDKIFGLDNVPIAQPDSPQSDDSKPRKSKRSKRSYSPRASQRKSYTTDAVPLPFPKQKQLPTRSSTTHLHPLDSSAPPSSTVSSSSSSARSATPFPNSNSTPQQLHHHISKSADRSTSRHQESHIRLRTISDFGSSNPHALVRESHSASRKSKSSRHKPRLELRLDWLSSNEGPSFIDMRDESLETDSKSDSWQSLFEVSCAA